MGPAAILARAGGVAAGFVSCGSPAPRRLGSGGWGRERGVGPGALSSQGPPLVVTARVQLPSALRPAARSPSSWGAPPFPQSSPHSRPRALGAAASVSASWVKRDQPWVGSCIGLLGMPHARPLSPTGTHCLSSGGRESPLTGPRAGAPRHPEAEPSPADSAPPARPVPRCHLASSHGSLLTPGVAEGGHLVTSVTSSDPITSSANLR